MPTQVLLEDLLPVSYLIHLRSFSLECKLMRCTQRNVEETINLLLMDLLKFTKKELSSEVLSQTVLESVVLSQLLLEHMTG